jgi:F0F1-type ATP synthase membrane subunit b/b'
MIPEFLAESIPLPGFEGISVDGRWYYAACAFLFLLLGLVLGYFIWKKGHMQMLDAEAEVRRTREELARLKEDLKAEENELGEETTAQG